MVVQLGTFDENKALQGDLGGKSPCFRGSNPINGSLKVLEKTLIFA